MYGLTVDELKQANNLTSNLLSVGQKLIIPDKKIADNVYIVKAGDSLYSIAQKYNTTVDELKRLNNLTSNNLSIGQQLKLPSNTDETQNDTNNIYIVKSGDSLYKIANMYGISVDELKQANNLTSNLLSIGQTLIIPNKNNYLTYTVQSGDSLYSIARKYNTTVTDIINLNNLATTNLSIGQKLLIPN